MAEATHPSLNNMLGTTAAQRGQQQIKWLQKFLQLKMNFLAEVKLLEAEWEHDGVDADEDADEGIGVE